MFKSSAGKIFFGFFLAGFVSSCSLWRGGETTVPPSPTPFVAAEIKSEIPFSTKEPEVYQAELISRVYAEGVEKTSTKIFTARKGARRLTVFNAGEKAETSLLETGADRTFSIRTAEKIYTDNQFSTTESETANDFLTAEWLNQKTAAAFETLGEEGGLLKFRVKIPGQAEAGAAETPVSEVLIYIDKNLSLPVRQEFYSINGEQRFLTFSVEMKNFRTEVDEKLFELPADYRKISPKEFQEILWRERIKND